ncbi:MAG: glycoside hydrolase family 3 C-terminal domain-containing protein [Lachnospiraceae bacterium]|nr:glycoside hydrolase family 3 C-terminal domain-containing protein [Lachnospiraceae bacterium]
MKRWARALYQPNLPLKKEGRVTASKEHIALSEKAAAEGMVLLKNERNTLPLQRGKRVALFGKGTFDYVKGGGGSGDVGCPYIRNLYEGLKKLGNTEAFEPLADYYRDYVSDAYKGKKAAPGLIPEAEVPSDLLAAAVAYTDTAVYTISRFSAEGWDRSEVVCKKEANPWEDEVSMPELAAGIYPKGDFYLTDREEETLDLLRKRFSSVIVVINAGGMMDLRFVKGESVDAALLAWQGGMEGGLAAAELLTGLKNPSGRLPDTFAGELGDYPSTGNFHESFDYVEYTEDIYVGYRYFETIAGAAEKVVYPFGWGLSYTTFSEKVSELDAEGEEVRAAVQVTNTGRRSGKEAVLLYFSAPQGKLGKPKRELLTYAKTRDLMPGETQTLILTAPRSRMASFDDTGLIKKSAFVLEEGEYRFFLGGDVRSTLPLEKTLLLKEAVVCEACESLLPPTSLHKRLRSDGSFEELPAGEPLDLNECIFEKLAPGQAEGIMPEAKGRERHKLFEPYMDGKFSFTEVAEGRKSLEDFLASLDDDELIHLCGGQPNTGVANTCGFLNMPEYDLPSFMTADGPAGVRIAEETGITTTAWPCGTLLAASFDQELVCEVGRAGGEELLENNLYIWLAPGMNIHRNPMCGRNFEYYSEDPVVTGLTAAAFVKGVQENGISACPKHFAANNKETNRKHSDSRVSERALREIYLKGFCMVVKDAKPYVIMTAYNAINGQRASESHDLLTKLLRNEWGYQGIVCSDWWNRAEHYKEILAGNDIKMATGFPERVKKAMELGALNRGDLLACAGRILEFALAMP